jgi:CheY-like chemotaxis protein
MGAGFPGGIQGAAMAQRILVGDDNEQMRRLIVELLEADGHEVREARDTGEVLEQVIHARFDLLVLDLHMPGGGGIEGAPGDPQRPRQRFAARAPAERLGGPRS